MARSPSSDRCAETIIDEDKVRQAEQVLLDGLAATRLADTFSALADPTRVRIISILLYTELCVCDLAATLGMTQSAVSHQLRLMRDMRLVKSHKEGRMVYYALDDEHIRDLFLRGREHVEHK
ncbi:MAG: transcriptional regulator [Anaerolineae bacterium]|nr:helix-turn-helix transcriptional regulator [Anaerolineales bacterium]MCQ3973207.1 transcriptional regulator [Anaerolineae bacterium]